MLIRPAAESRHLPEVAAWLHAEWWQGEALQATEAYLRAAAGPAAPCALVAEAGGRPLGTASLEVEDLPGRPDLSPWLASVLVTPEHRRRGVATALVQEVLRRARLLGHRQIWLFTADQAPFYAARGWAPAGAETWRGRAVTLMRHDLAP
jgi:predicted N-acetyltransferase YhbS